MPAPANAIRCPACGAAYAYKPELAGRRLKCRCGAAIQVPAAEPAPVPADFDDAVFTETAPAAHVPPTPVPPTPQAPAGPNAAPDQGTADKSDGKWWSSVGFGVLMIPLAIYEFSRLSDLDDGVVQRVRLKAWEAAIYSVLGKWGVLAVMLLLAAVLIGYGVHEFLQQRKRSAR